MKHRYTLPDDAAFDRQRQLVDALDRARAAARELVRRDLVVECAERLKGQADLLPDREWAARMAAEVRTVQAVALRLEVLACERRGRERTV